MKMIQVTFSGKNKSEVWGAMNEYLNNETQTTTTTAPKNTGTTWSDDSSVTPVTPKRTKGSSKKDVDETFDLDQDQGADDLDSLEATSDDGDELETEEEEETTAPKVTKGQILKAFSNYAAKKGRDKALAILSSLKVKTVHAIPTEKYETVWKKLNS